MRQELTASTLRLTFSTFDQDEYALFLRTKSLPEHEVIYDELADAYTVETPARFARILGFEAPRVEVTRLEIPAFHHDYQRFFIGKSIDAKRYAIWADTGLGKTLIILEWMRQVLHLTNGKVLGIFLLNTIPQVLAMAAEFYGADFPEVRVLGSRAELRAWCLDGRPGLAITNPEKFIPGEGDSETMTEITHCTGIALDESSLLKTGGGVIKWALIKSCRGVEYKLSCTATPAPNDPIEYASQASWLEKIRDEGEVIWTYFTRDADGEWKVKQHALATFYRFLAGWSCYLRSPKRYGFRDNLATLPDPVRIVHRIEPTPEQLREARDLPRIDGRKQLWADDRIGIVERGAMAQLAAGFVYTGGGAARYVPSRKPAVIAEIVRSDVAAGLQVIVWTNYDETAAMITRELAGGGLRVVTLTGATPKPERPGILDRYRAGEVDVLITRPKILGFGQNLQCCGSMVFADINDSFEQIYSCERRAYRYGQTKSVHIHAPIVRDLQDVVWENVQAKAARFQSDVETMEGLYIEAMRDELARRVA